MGLLLTRCSIYGRAVDCQRSYERVDFCEGVCYHPIGMPRRTSAPEDVSVTDAHLKAQQERLRQQRIRLLRRELEATMERLHTIRRELRLLGDDQVRVTTGGTDWNEVYARLGSTFTAKAMAALLAETQAGHLPGPVVFVHTGGLGGVFGGAP